MSTVTVTVKTASDMADMLRDIARLARNANYIMQEIQEEYFEATVPNDPRSRMFIVNEFERNSVRADVVSDIICRIAEMADADVPVSIV